MDDLTWRGNARRPAVWLAIAWLVVAAAPAAAQAPAPVVEAPWTGLTLLHDNDGLPNAGNTFRDDNYSAGIAIRLSGAFVHDAGLDWPLDGLDRVLGARRLHARGGHHSHAVTIVGAAYTPNDLLSTAPVRDDRPFASLVGVSVRRVSIARDERATWSTELMVGALGLDAAREVQTLLHRTRRWMTGNAVPPDPQGWSNQISNGGEPTARYRAAYEHLVAGDTSGAHRKHWQATAGADGALGFQTNVGAGLGLRVGTFTSDFWEPSSGALGAGPGSQRRSPTGSRWELFGFAGARARVVGYDAILQGQFRRSVHTVHPRRLLGEWEGGIGIGVPAGPLQIQTLIGLAQGRTTEWRGAQAHPATWGSVSIAITRPRR